MDRSLRGESGPGAMHSPTDEFGVSIAPNENVLIGLFRERAFSNTALLVGFIPSCQLERNNPRYWTSVTCRINSQKGRTVRSLLQIAQGEWATSSKCCSIKGTKKMLRMRTTSRAVTWFGLGRPIDRASASIAFDHFVLNYRAHWSNCWVPPRIVDDSLDPARHASDAIRKNVCQVRQAYVRRS